MRLKIFRNSSKSFSNVVEKSSPCPRRFRFIGSYIFRFGLFPQARINETLFFQHIFTDTASDDSNYETLFSSFPSDEFSSGTEDGDESSVSNSSPQGVGGNGSRLDPISGQEAPSRPVPPPPRESSLTESLGKRMKMLRRTWSITKGSLGRMRRRTSTTSNGGDTTDPNSQPLDDGANKYFHSDPRKYFSFKKHFRKGSNSAGVTGLSRFYLGTSDFLDNERLASNNNRSSKEEIYSNSSGESNWYTNSEYWRTRDAGGNENGEIFCHSQIFHDK